MRKLISYLLVMITAVSSAQIQVTLDHGLSSALPMRFALSENTTDLPFAAKIAAVVRHDLMLSGHFQVSKINTHASNLRQGSDEYELALTVGTAVDGKYPIEATLTNLIDPEKKKILSLQGQVYADRWRDFAHAISDGVFTKLTDVPGIFSTKLAFIHVEHASRAATKYQLNIVDVDGEREQVLIQSTEPLMSPAWSPDGQKIAYVSFEHGQSAIYVQTIATGQRTRVAVYPGVNGAPSWSPDGQSMALVLSQGAALNIHILDLKTHQLQQITHGETLDTEPVWDHQGRSLYFTSNRHAGVQIFRYWLDTGKVEQVTHDGAYNARASLSADDRFMAMIHKEQGLYAIAVQDLMTGRVYSLTSSYDHQSPSFAPNGDRVVYSTLKGNRGVLAQVSRDGQVSLTLPADHGDIQDPAWSPYFADQH